eukprot:PhF_6_TR43684/c0_g1_i1/m.67137
MFECSFLVNCAILKKHKNKNKQKMKSIIYDASATPEGIRFTTVPAPTLAHVPYTHLTSSPPLRRILFRFIDFIFFFVSLWMRALRFIFSSIPPPYGSNPKRQLILCRVLYAGVNPVDAKFLYGDKLPHFCLPLVQWFVRGRICGIDFSGEVVEVPPSCTQFRVGDRVFGTMPPFNGTFCEYVRVPSDFITHAPKTISPAEASVVPLVGLTTLQCFTDNNVKAGQHVLVLGASGGTGHFAVQVAKNIIKANVTAVCSQRNEAFVRSLGADHVVCYDDSTDVIVALQKIVSSSGFGPVSFVFDGVSSHDPRDSAFGYETRLRTSTSPAILTPTAKYIIIGGLVHDWFKAHVKRFFGVNLFGKSRLLFWVRFPNSSEYLDRLKEAIDNGLLVIKVSSVYPLTEAGVRSAFRDQMNRRVIGKACIGVNETTL